MLDARRDGAEQLLQDGLELFQVMRRDRASLAHKVQLEITDCQLRGHRRLVVAGGQGATLAQTALLERMQVCIPLLDETSLGGTCGLDVLQHPRRIGKHRDPADQDLVVPRQLAARAHGRLHGARQDQHLGLDAVADFLEARPRPQAIAGVSPLGVGGFGARGQRAAPGRARFPREAVSERQMPRPRRSRRPHRPTFALGS